MSQQNSCVFISCLPWLQLRLFTVVAGVSCLPWLQLRLFTVPAGVSCLPWLQLRLFTVAAGVSCLPWLQLRLFTVPAGVSCLPWLQLRLFTVAAGNPVGPKLCSVGISAKTSLLPGPHPVSNVANVEVNIARPDSVRHRTALIAKVIYLLRKQVELMPRFCFLMRFPASVVCGNVCIFVYMIESRQKGHVCVFCVPKISE